jgi:hypothetical protein
VDRPFKRRDISIRTEITEFSSKCESLRFAGIVFPLKLTCTTFGAYNGVERAFKRQDITIRNEITGFWVKLDSLRFAICMDCFDTEIDVHNVRCV